MISTTGWLRRDASQGKRGRKNCLAFMLLVFMVLPGGMSGAALAKEPEPFSWPQLVETARSLATTGFKEPEPAVPKVLMDLTYDQWRQIRFQPEKSLWRDQGLPFELQFFHLGLYYNRPVRINVIDEAGYTSPLLFSPDFFKYGQNYFEASLPPDLGWAGFRIHFPIKNPDYKDEVAVFLGASYFRGIGKDHHYGLSARGLAVDVASPSGEEFPFFREFWIEKPTPNSAYLIVYGLLDGPGTTGAFKFKIVPGQETVMEVDSILFQRHKVQKLGIAPMTSMFFYGEDEKHPKGDFRPEVHDSDGVQVAHKSGEWLWRPLALSNRLQVNGFMVRDNNLAGFGLIQRDVNFDHYQDLEARYDLRPGIWIEPRGNWGPGRVELVEIPTDKEIYDNVVAYWVPEGEAPLKKPIPFNYTLFWHTPGLHGPPGGRVAATRKSSDPANKSLVKLVVDFEGGELGAIDSADGLEAIVTAGPETKITSYQLMRNPVTKGWRLVFVLDLSDGAWDKAAEGKNDVIELRAFLKKGETVLTETWSYGVKR
ncbi:MAG: glucan biosynthesis protein G [Pseudomonadota bacterium]